MAVRLRDRIILCGIAAVVFSAPLMLGGAPRWAALSLSLGSVALASLYLSSSREFARQPPLFALLIAAIGLTAFQLLPLPAGVLEILSPAKLELVEANAHALGAGSPSWAALSYDPAATLMELAKLIGYLAFAFVVSRAASSPKRRRILLGFVAAAGILVAIISLTHLLLGAEQLYGLYTPQSKPAAFVAPLINENHLAGYLALVTPLALGLAIESSGVERGMWSVGALLTTGVALLSKSRGGVIALGIGLLVALGFYLAQRRGSRQGPLPRSVLLSFAAIVVSAIVLMAALTAGGITEELSTTSANEIYAPESKFGAWSSATSVVADHPWTGIGRGAFEYVFTSAHPSGDITYSHLENEYLQVLVDWGILGALLLAALLLNVVGQVMRRSRAGVLQGCAIGSLTALAVHNVVDFNLQLPAVALAAIVLIGCVCSPALKRIHTSRRVSSKILRHSLVVAATAVIALASTPVGRSARAEADELASRRPIADAADLAMSAMERHPADYAIAGLAARSLFAAGDPRAVAVINRALAMSPENPGLHHLAARILARSQNPEQALLEYRLALASSARPRPILRNLLRDFPARETAITGLPLEPERGTALARDLDAMGHPGVALDFLRALAYRHPTEPSVLRAYASVALGGNQLGESADAARRLYQAEPSPHAARLYARALRAADRLPEAESVLKDALATAQKRLNSEEIAHLSLILGDLLGTTQRLKEATAAYRGVLAVTRRPALQLAAHQRLAELEARLGNHRAAEAQRQRARALQRMFP